MNNYIFRAKKIPIYPTDDQKKKIKRYIELYRFVYNWTLEQEQNQLKLYKEGKAKYNFTTYFELTPIFTKYRKENEWLKELPLSTCNEAISKAVKSYKLFFKGLKRYPKFKSKKSKETLCLKSKNLYFENNLLKVPGIKEKIYTEYYNPIRTLKNRNDEDLRCRDASILIDNLGNYYFSFVTRYKCPIKEIAPDYNRAIGIDLGIRRTFILSTGEMFTQPDLTKLMKKRSRLVRKHNKDVRRARQERTNPDDELIYSKRATKRILAYRKCEKKIHDIKDTFYHTITKQIVMRNPKAIVMEDLPLQTDLYKKRYIANKIQTVSFYDIRVKMEYKCEMYKVPFILAPRNFKSSQICSNCGAERNIHGAHIYRCHKCGAQIDRDINAAINLEKLAYI